MSKDAKKILETENLERVAGGADNYGKSCPDCGSSNIDFKYSHDEIGVFYCNNCHKNVSIRY